MAAGAATTAGSDVAAPSGTSLAGAVHCGATLDASTVGGGGGGGGSGGGLGLGTGGSSGGGGGGGGSGKGLGGSAINTMLTRCAWSCPDGTMPACEVSQSSAK